MAKQAQDNSTIVWVEVRITEINFSTEIKKMVIIQTWSKAFRARVIRAFKIINNTSNFRRNTNDGKVMFKEDLQFFKVHNIEAQAELSEIQEEQVQDN